MTDGTGVVVTQVLVGDRVGGAATVLRAFDRARRALSDRVSGVPGAGAGYDVLLVDHDALWALPPATWVTISAEVVEEWSGRHAVEYLAFVTSSEGSAEARSLVRARGWTLARTRTLAGVRRS